jgi:hypothetical protein
MSEQSRRFALPLVLFALVCIIHGAITAGTWQETYWDFGDGNYLYVGQRINDGLIPYRDILAPQPPLHLLQSAASQRLGEILLGDSLRGAQGYNLFIRIVQGLMLFIIAMRLFGCAWRGLFASTLHLFLPIGFWWGLCMMSENLEIVFLLAAFLGILALNREGAALAGAASALAMHCNMTAVPYFMVNLLFLLCRRPRLAAWYGGIGVGVWLLGALLAWMWAGPAYLDNVLFNQVGSFPRSDILSAGNPGYTFWHYAYDKVTSQGGNVIRMEGLWILLACLSLLTGTRDTLRASTPGSPASLRWEFAAWSALGMWFSICFTMKGGTMDYIFVIGEPAVALFAADAMVRIVSRLRALIWKQELHAPLRSLASLLPQPRNLTAIRFNQTLPVLQVIYTVAFVFTLLVLINLAVHTRYAPELTRSQTLGRLPGAWGIKHILDESQAELPHAGVQEIKAIIERHTRPGDPILAPPFYARITGRVVAAELAENYLWHIKVMNESFDGIEGEGIIKMEEVAGMLRRREVPLVLLDMKMTGQVPAIRHAIDTFYEPIDPPFVQTRNAPLELYRPRLIP